jgi:hypothetical protein
VTDSAHAAEKGDTHEAPSFDASLVVRKPRHVAGRAGIGVVALGTVMLFALIGVRGPWPAVAQLAILVGAAIAGWAGRFPRSGETRVTATREALTVFGERIPRAKIKTALLRHEGVSTFARFDLKGGRRVDVHVKSDEQANRLFSALELDAMSSTAEVDLFPRGPMSQLVALVPALTLIFGVSWGQMMFGPIAIFASAFFLVATIVVWARLRRVKMSIGADGIRVKEGLRKPVFYKHEDIQGVASDGVRVDVALKNGKVKMWNASPAKQPKQDQIELARSIVRRILDARRAHDALDVVPADARALARAGRESREWIDALKRLGDGAQAGFREAAVSRDALLRVVESTRASAVERLAAALALKPSLTQEEAPRIRIAAERCALPELSQRLRVVVDSESPEEAEAALIEAEAAESVSSARERVS